MQPTSEHIALVTETQQIVEAVLQGRLPLEKLLEHCPLSADLAQEITAKFATVEHPDPRAGSLRFAVEQLTALHNPLAGLGGALALGNHWRQRVRQTDIGYVRHHLGLSIAAEMFALKQLGQHEAILSHAEQNAALVADADMPFTTTLMAVYCADALLELGRLDEARDLLPSREAIHEAGRQEEAVTGSPPRVNLAITLRDNAAMNANFMTEAGIGEIQDFETRTRIALDETLVSVKSMLAQVGESEAEILAFEQEIENLACRRTTGTAERLHYFAELMEMLRRRLGKYAPGLSFHDDDMEIIAIGLRADDEAAIVQALAASTRMMALQAARGDVSGWQSHAWTHAVLLEKSGRDSEALDQLEQIRRSRDDAVARASSARERAAIAGAFADLAPRLARLRALGGAPPSAVFEAIEWGKGQWLANGAPVPALREFKTALERAGVHYLTFLSGSSFTLGLSITASGEVVFREITIGRDQLEAAILSIRHDPAYRAAIIRNLPAQLGALMDWVPAEATAGTLIIAPHGPLFELPLHILPCASGLPLAPTSIVARTHNAAALARRLACETTRPESQYALYAPLRTELAQPARATRFDSVAATLAQILPGQMATGPDASFEALAGAARPNQLIHIWAHGDSAYDGRYFSRTGILLAAKGQLPQRGWSNFTEPHLLSPQKLLDAEPRLDFTGSHVTLQACVSAHGKANFQGDAIGLEWAFLLSGATSVLGTYWHIDYSVAAEFCRRLYAGWLTEKLTRGEAWRQTVKSMMQEAGPNSVDWAAFTLAGDWR